MVNIFGQSANTPASIRVPALSNSLRGFIQTTVNAAVNKSVAGTDERTLIVGLQKCLLEVAGQLEIAAKDKVLS